MSRVVGVYITAGIFIGIALTLLLIAFEMPLMVIGIVTAVAMIVFMAILLGGFVP